MDVEKLVARARGRRWCHLAVANLRILVGFAFVPAGLKKIMGQPFTDPGNTGAFHEFLHAFAATGFFYHFVGGVQLVIAVLLMTQRYAALGAAMALPVLAAITAFCWSTAGLPTCIVVTLMTLATVGLLAWDLERWRGFFTSAPSAAAAGSDATLASARLWGFCGAAILVFYGITCLFSGGVYRPRGPELDNPAFYALPLIALFPVVTFFIERHRRRA